MSDTVTQSATKTKKTSVISRFPQSAADIQTIPITRKRQFFPSKKIVVFVTNDDSHFLCAAIIRAHFLCAQLRKYVRATY